jgi:hypothetical protein
VDAEDTSPHAPLVLRLTGPDPGPAYRTRVVDEGRSREHLRRWFTRQRPAGDQRTETFPDRGEVIRASPNARSRVPGHRARPLDEPVTPLDGVVSPGLPRYGSGPVCMNIEQELFLRHDG